MLEENKIIVVFSKKHGEHLYVLYLSIYRLHATKYPDGWDFNGVSCNTDCNTANTCKTDGDDYILVPVASENGRNPEKSWTRLDLFGIKSIHYYYIATDIVAIF